MIKRGDSRGLSTIVATLLIILLTLVAVGIIWVVVRNVMQQGSEQVSLGKFTLNLEIEAVTIDPAVPNSFSLRVKRNAGAGEISGLKFIVDDGDSAEVFELNNYSMRELEEKVVNISLKSITNASNIKKVSVVPIFKLESGKEITGDVKDEYTVTKSSVVGGADCIPICAGKHCGSDGCGGTCGSCVSPQTCNASGQCAGSCTPNCVGKVCGSDGCSGSCGTCQTGTCNATGQCVTTCTAESNTTFCSRLNKNCGIVTALDNCGTSRTVISCGTCISPQVCNGTGQCATNCTSETNSAFCTRLGKVCGSVTAADNCGTQRTVTSCGTCTSPQVCNGTGQCATNCTAESNTTFCTRLNRVCGSVSGTDNCGNSRSVTSCGTCTSPQTCNATGRCVAPAYTYIAESISSGTDDAEESVSFNNLSTTSTDLEITFDGLNQYVGLRFMSVNIPQGAKIESAILEFSGDGENQSGAGTIKIFGQDINNAPTFSTTTGNITGRALTSNYTSWTFGGAWGVAGTKYNSSDLKNVLQEIVDRVGWNANNNLVIVINSSITSNVNSRVAESYDKGAGVTKLYIVYS